MVARTRLSVTLCLVTINAATTATAAAAAVILPQVLHQLIKIRVFTKQLQILLL